MTRITKPAGFAVLAPGSSRAPRRHRSLGRGPATRQSPLSGMQALPPSRPRRPKHRIGPHLNDVFGRRAGSLPKFRYSPAMKKAGAGGLVWTEATLDAFVANPRKLVPRSRMSYAGMTAARDRVDLLAWLRALSTSRVRASGRGTHHDRRRVRPRPAAPCGRGRPRVRRLSGQRVHHLSPARTAPMRAYPPSSVGRSNDFVITLQAYKHGKTPASGHADHRQAFVRRRDRLIGRVFRQTAQPVREKGAAIMKKESEQPQDRKPRHKQAPLPGIDGRRHQRPCGRDPVLGKRPPAGGGDRRRRRRRNGRALHRQGLRRAPST